MQIQTTNTHFNDSMFKIHREVQKQEFQKKINKFLVTSQCFEQVYKTYLINYTSLYNSQRHYFGFGTYTINNNNKINFLALLDYNYVLDPINGFSIGIRLNKSEKNFNYDLSINKHFNENTRLSYLIKPNKIDFWTIAFQHKNSYISLREKGLKVVISSDTQISPYVKLDFNQPDSTIIGITMKLKQFEIQCYKSLKKIQQFGLTIGLLLNVDNWKVGFKMNLGELNGYLSFYLQKFGIGVQFPFYQIQYENLIDKYTVIGITSLFFCAILKCLQQPIQLPDTINDRINKSREVLQLLERKTKQQFQYEKDNNGLIIYYAYYGNAEHINILKQQDNKIKFLQQSELEIIDVTLACQFQVKNSVLNLPSYSKQVLLGFCDPCKQNDTPKLLLLEYTYKSVHYSKIVNDLENITLP